MGFGDVLQPTAGYQSQHQTKARIEMKEEVQDELKRNVITFQIVSFKTRPETRCAEVPKKLMFQMRFFTFREIVFPVMQLFHPNYNPETMRVEPGKYYYLKKYKKPSLLATKNQVTLDAEEEEKNSLDDKNTARVSFEIDPSVSKMFDEHIRLAEYLKERYVTIDLYDANSRFHYATTKIPMFYLMRQGRPRVTLSKELEMCSPDSSEFRGAIQVVMINEGHKEKHEIVGKVKGLGTMSAEEIEELRALRTAGVLG